MSWKREPRLTLERRTRAAIAPSVASSTCASSAARSTSRRCAGGGGRRATESETAHSQARARGHVASARRVSPLPSTHLGGGIQLPVVAAVQQQRGGPQRRQGGRQWEGRRRLPTSPLQGHLRALAGATQEIVDAGEEREPVEEVGLAVAGRQGERHKRLGQLLGAKRQQWRLHRRHAGWLRAMRAAEAQGASDHGEGAAQAGRTGTRCLPPLGGRTTASRRPLLTSRMALSATARGVDALSRELPTRTRRGALRWSASDEAPVLEVRRGRTRIWRRARG